jgi:hypothetical protein
MENTRLFIDELTGVEYIIIDKGNNEFSSMLKSFYDEMKANEATVI